MGIIKIFFRICLWTFDYLQNWPKHGWEASFWS